MKRSLKLRVTSACKTWSFFASAWSRNSRSTPTIKRGTVAVSLLLLLIPLTMSPMIFATPPQPHIPHHIRLGTTSTSGNVWQVGAYSSDPSALPNVGIQAVIQVVSQPVSNCGELSFWASDALSNNMWGQVGYFISCGSTPVAFAEIWNLNTYTYVTQKTSSVSTGYHTFSMYLQTGTTWAFALDGVVFFSYDMGASVSSSTYPVYALSEEGYTGNPFPFSAINFNLAMQSLQSGAWNNVQRAAAYGSTWGVQGNLQDSTLSYDQTMVGTSISVTSAGTQLWNGSSATTTSVTSTSSSTSTSSTSTTATTISSTTSTTSSSSTTTTAVSDTTPPTVSITSPAAGSTVKGTVTISATAFDNVGIQRVQFYIDGKLKATVTALPYSYGWQTKSAKNGTHTILVIAYDNAGNSAQTSITVTVHN